MKNLTISSKIIGLFLGLLMALVPNLSFAQTKAAVDVDPEGSNQCANITLNLRYGMTDAQTGNQVSMLQDFLYSNHFMPIPGNGYFGVNTRQAVKKFQAQYNLGDSGFVGPMTRIKIHEVDCNRNTTTAINNSTNSTTTINTSTVPGCNSTLGFSPVNGMRCDSTNEIIITPTVDGINNYQTKCLPNSKPWVTLISPNGGEELYDATTFSTKWKTCNIPDSSNVAFKLINDQNQSVTDMWINTQGGSFPSNITNNDSEESIFIAHGSPIKEGNYKIQITVQNDEKNKFTDIITDVSDKYFTLKQKPKISDYIKVCWNKNTLESNCTLPTNSQFTTMDFLAGCPNGNLMRYDCKSKPIPKTTPTNSIYSTSIPYDKECTATSEPFVALLSPNGGESLTVAQPFTAKWKSCNVPPNYLVTFGLQDRDNGGFYSVNITNGIPGYSKGITVNDGEEEISPTGFGSFAAGQYKLRIILGPYQSNEIKHYSSNEPWYSDSSDNSLSVVWSNS